MISELKGTQYVIAAVQVTVDPVGGAHGNSAAFEKRERAAVLVKSCFLSTALEHKLTNAVLAQVIGW